jgi:hypothetical protein
VASLSWLVGLQVIAFDHNVRQASVNLFADRGKDDATSSGTTVDGAVKFVHNDYTDKSGPQRVRDFSIAGGSYTVNGALLSEVEAEQVLRGRYAFINVWRALNVADDVPLAVRLPSLCVKLAPCVFLSLLLLRIHSPPFS